MVARFEAARAREMAKRWNGGQNRMRKRVGILNAQGSE